MPVYTEAALALMRDIFWKEGDIPSGSAVLVQLFNGDPDDDGSSVVSDLVDLPWLLTQLAAPMEVKEENPGVVSLGPAPGGGWDITHVRVYAGPEGEEIGIWKSTVAGGTLNVPAGWYVNIPAGVLWSILQWPWGDSGGGETPHIKFAAIAIFHALGGTNEIRSGGDFIVELWDHDPLHVGHGTPLTFMEVGRTESDWTETEGPPEEMENTNAIESGEAPEDGWDVTFVTMRISGSTAFIYKSSDHGATVTEGNTLTIAAGGIQFTLSAT